MVMPRANPSQPLDTFFAGGGTVDDLPPGVVGAAAQRLRQAFRLFDEDHDGKLDDRERGRLMETIRTLAQ